MICLADNDYVLKLSACDLLDDALNLFAVGRSEVYVLPTAKYKIAKDKRLRAKYGDGIDRALSFLASVVEISVEPDAEELALLNEVKDPDTGQRRIHEGEQVLFASTKTLEDFLLATGDKNCLQALASCSSCTAIHARHLGRVVCVEQTLLWLIKNKGFQYVLEKVVPAAGCDTALRATFGSGLSAEQENVTRALMSYVDELSQVTAGLLKQDL